MSSLKGSVVAFQLQLMAAKHSCWGNVASFSNFFKEGPILDIYLKSSDF